MEENRNESTTEQSSQSIFSALLSDPEKISKIKGIIDNLTHEDNGENSPQIANIPSFDEKSDSIEKINQGIERDNSPQSENAANFDAAAKLPEILSLFAGQNLKNATENKEQIALLLAIRPYLSENRKQLIDTFIKFNRISHILKKL